MEAITFPAAPFTSSGTFNAFNNPTNFSLPVFPVRNVSLYVEFRNITQSKTYGSNARSWPFARNPHLLPSEQYVNLKK